MSAANNDGDGGDSKPKPTYSTRVFKKASPNNKITTYLGRRDFFDDGEKVDIVDGVVLVDKDYLNRETGWKVFVHLMAAFRYGREDFESLAGLVYKKEIYSKFIQVYPPVETNKKITRLQDRLIKKLGDNAYSFLFELPRHLAPSISIHPAANENGKPCGVDYQLSSFVAFSSDEKPDKKNSVRMAIKKLNLSLDAHRKQPSVELKKDFVLSNYPVCIEARLDKELYIHGEDIKLFLNIENRSSKTLKSIAVEVKQYADVSTGGISATYKSVVALLDSEAGFPVNPSSHMSQTYSLLPSMDCNTRQETKRGCALDGQYKVGDSNLAATSVITENPTAEMKEAQAVVVQYKLKAKLTVLRGTDIKFDLPFRLTHTRPAEPVFVRKGGNDGNSQYVSVTQTEAANLMSTMSEYAQVKKSSSNGGIQEKAREAAAPSSAPASRSSSKQGASETPTLAAAPAPAAAATATTAPANNDLLIDLMDFNASSSAPAVKAVNQLQDFGAASAPGQQQQPSAIYSQPVKHTFDQVPQPAQPVQQSFAQPQQQQAFSTQPSYVPFTMNSMNPFSAPQQQQQPFMPAQQQQQVQAPGMFGGAGMMMQQPTAAASNPFAAPMMQQQQQPQQPFGQPQQPQQPFGQPQQAFMMQQAPQQQQQQAQGFAANFPAFGSAGVAQANPQPPKNEEDLFFEEFVNMRVDGSDI